VRNLRIAICDDEKKYRDMGLMLCKKYFNNKKIPVEFISFSSGESVLAYTEKIDLILLDIEMKGIDGLEVKEILRKQNKNSSIIYITNHEELIKPAFGKNVYGFLTKPFHEDELYRILDVICKDRINQKLIQIDSNTWVKKSEIKYIKAEDKYCRFYTIDMEYLIRCRIRDMEDLLQGNDFHRIHRSYIINFKYVKKIAQKIMMDDNTVLPYSRNKKEQIINSYNAYLIDNAW